MAGGAKNIPGLSRVPKIRALRSNARAEQTRKSVTCVTYAEQTRNKKFCVSFAFEFCVGFARALLRSAVGERFQRSEAESARIGGVLGSENVGMSNHIYNEKLYPQKSKVSVAMAINHGLGDPKAMARAVAKREAG